MRSRGLLLLKNLCVLLASVAIFFGLLEGGLRLSGRVSANALRSPDLKTLATIPGMFEPDQDFVDRILPELPFRVRTNSLGFRGPEIARSRPPGVYRILCLGDSYTFGPYVREEETLPARLQEHLAAASGKTIEVVNGGVNGFTIIDELRFLEERALGVEPNLVIVLFSQNDLQDLRRPRSTIDLMQDHAAVKSAFLVGPFVKLLQKTATFNMMQRAAARLKGFGRRSGGETGPGIAAGAEADEDGREIEWARYEEALRRIASHLGDKGLPFVLACWPSARQMSGDDSMVPQARLASVAAAAGVRFVDLTPAIAHLAESGRPAFLVPLDGHPTAASYDAAATLLSRSLGSVGQSGE